MKVTKARAGLYIAETEDQGTFYLIKVEGAWVITDDDCHNHEFKTKKECMNWLESNMEVWC